MGRGTWHTSGNMLGLVDVGSRSTLCEVRFSTLPLPHPSLATGCHAVAAALHLPHPWGGIRGCGPGTRPSPRLAHLLRAPHPHSLSLPPSRRPRGRPPAPPCTPCALRAPAPAPCALLHSRAAGMPAAPPAAPRCAAAHPACPPGGRAHVRAISCGPPRRAPTSAVRVQQKHLQHLSPSHPPPLVPPRTVPTWCAAAAARASRP